jgi:purine-cytosine permease-like protein
MDVRASEVPRLEVSQSDDPRVVEEAAIEDYSLHVVPRTWRSSRGSIAMAFYAIASAMFFVIVSATIALAVGSVNTVIGMILAAIVTGTVGYVISSYAAKYGLSVAQFSRHVFGLAGASLATLILAASLVYFAVFESSVIAQAFNTYFGGIGLPGWYLVVVLYSVPLVIGGVHVWLGKFNGTLLPFYCLGLLVAVVWTIMEYGYSDQWITYTPEDLAAIAGPGWMFAFTVYMGNWIQMMVTMDFARFGREEDARFNGIVTFGPVFYLFVWVVNGLVGLFLIFSIPTEGELTELSGVLGLIGLMGLVGVLFVWISQTRINTVNYYLASTNWQNFFARVFRLRLSRLVWLIIIGIVVYVVMLSNVFGYILQALRVQGVFVISWVGITLVQIIHDRVRGTEPEFRPGRVRRINPAGVSAWVVSSAVGLGLIFGSGSFGATFGLPLTFVIATVLYSAALLLAPESWFILARPHDPRDEVSDVWEDRVRCGSCDRFYVAYEMDRDPSMGHRPVCMACAAASPSLVASAHEEAESLQAATASELRRSSEGSR